VKEAIHYYSKAHCLTNAIKLAKEHHLDHDLMNLALQGTKEEMLDAAMYYESQPGMDDKAALLYHKGGNVARALTLSFRNKQFSTLQMMAGDLNEQTDPELLDRCAHFFLENEQYDKAVDLLVKAQKHFEALELCMRHNVQITEDMAERLTLPKPSKEQASENEYRTRLLERLGECCTHQGSYHLATKKFTQAGNKLKAMKSLLKSQDMERIIFFTNVSRQREVYIMAANFLQQQEWRKDPEIMKHIISFYTKGKSLESLAGFYDACAQVEIDDYQNYEKALGALNEALKCMTKAKTKNAAEQESKVAFLKQRITLLRKFVEAKRLYSEQPQEAIKQCQLLLDEPDLETAVRVGDVYGFMVGHYAKEENYRQSYTLMEELRRRVPNVNMAYFVNMRVIEVVHRALDIPLGRGMGAEKSQEDEDSGSEEIEDEVEEDLYNGDVDGAGY
jgi:intraflagellar transport protein 140